MLRSLCVLAAVTFSACTSTTNPYTPIVIEHTLNSDAYDADGNIVISDRRIKATHHYGIELVYLDDTLGIAFANSFHPELAGIMKDQHAIDIAITLSDGFIRIADPDRTLLAYAEAAQELYDVERKPAYLRVYLED